MLNPGGGNAVQTTMLGGDLVQSAGCIYAPDIGRGGTPSDLIDATGTAGIAGTVRASLLFLMPGAPVTALRAAGGVTDNGATIADTFVVDYGLLFPGTEMQVGINGVNFTQTNTSNQRAIGGHFQDVWNAGGSAALAPFMGNVANFGDRDSFSTYRAGKRGGRDQGIAGNTAPSSRRVGADRQSPSTISWR